MPDEAEASKAKQAHECNAITCLGALRRTRMVRCVGRFRRLTEATQVGANDSVLLSEDRSYPVPGCVGARMPMQQQKRLSFATRTRSVASGSSIRSSSKPSNIPALPIRDIGGTFCQVTRFNVLSRSAA